MTFNRMKQQTVWHPKKYIPPKGTIARQRWDFQESMIDLLESEHYAKIYTQEMHEKSYGSTGDAYLLRLDTK